MTWLQSVDIENQNLESNSFYVLPYLYLNLKDLGINHPILTRLKGIYRRNWYQNQGLLSQCEPIIRSFTSGNIPLGVLGDFYSLIKIFPGQGVMRPSSLNLLVQPKDTRPALTHLGSLNIWPKVKYPLRFFRVAKTVEFWSTLPFRITLTNHLQHQPQIVRSIFKSANNLQIDLFGTDSEVYVPDFKLHFLVQCLKLTRNQESFLLPNLVEIGWL